MLFFTLILYCISFLSVWLGAGLIIHSIDRIARQLKVSSFAMSFFLLGILTSIPEIAISATAVAQGKPDIFVGTLLGGSIVMFLCIIPVLAIFGKGITINHDLATSHILLALLTVATPAFFVIDRVVTNLEGFLMLIIYIVLFYLVQKKHGIFSPDPSKILSQKAYSFLDVMKVGSGVALVFFASRFIVSTTLSLSTTFGIPAFYISLIVLSIGANLPELSIAIRAVMSGKKDIAFGDYLGSAAANTLLFGIFTLITHGEVLTTDSFFITFLFLVVGLGVFYYFSSSRRDISRLEGLILMGIYILFIMFELIKMLA